jgi:hypothetical protein
MQNSRKNLREAAQYYADRFDIADATERFSGYIRNNPQLWADVLENPSTLSRMLGQLVRDVFHAKRQNAAGSTKSGDTEEDREKRAAGRYRREGLFRDSILDWPVYGGRSIRDCTKSDLEQSVQLRRQQIFNHNIAVSFEQLVAEALPNKRVTVGEALSVDRLTNLYSEAFSSKAA